MKRTFLFVATLMLAVALSSGATSEQALLRIVSYNIRLATGSDGNNRWELRRQASVNMIREENPTIVGLQEALREQIDFLLDSLPDYDMVGVGRDDGAEQGEHMAILYNMSEVELLDWGTFWLSDTPQVPSFGWDAACRRTCTWAKFRHRASGERFAVLNTHLDHRGTVAQRRGLECLVEQCGRLIPLGMPIFLTGDMNITPDAAPLTMLTPHFEDSRLVAIESDERGTYNRWGRADRIIDYIFVRKATPLRYIVLRDKDYGAPFISDHYPILLEAPLTEQPYKSKWSTEFRSKWDEIAHRKFEIFGATLNILESETGIDSVKLAEYYHREKLLDLKLKALLAADNEQDSLSQKRGEEVLTNPLKEDLFSDSHLATARKLNELVNKKEFDSIIDCFSSVSLPKKTEFGIELCEENGFGDHSKPYVESANGQREYVVFKQLHIEPSASGAWQAYLLHTLTHILPLYWHAYYMERDYIFGSEEFMQAKTFGNDYLHTLTKGQTFDLRPQIFSCGEYFYVTCCYWTIFGGLIRECAEIKFENNKVVDIRTYDSEVLYEYRALVMY